jgi:hypothetical protein
VAILLLTPVVLSFLVLAAHYYRGAAVTNPTLAILLVIACLAAPSLLVVRRAWAVRVVQVLLIAGALEWLRTLVVLIGVREQMGRPWTAAAIILGSVAAFTLASAAVFLLPPLARWYRLTQGASPDAAART